MKLLLVMGLCVGLAAAAAYHDHDHHDYDKKDHDDHYYKDHKDYDKKDHDDHYYKDHKDYDKKDHDDHYYKDHKDYEKKDHDHKDHDHKDYYDKDHKDYYDKDHKDYHEHYNKDHYDHDHHDYDHKKKDHDHDHYDHDHYDHKKKDEDHDHYDHDKKDHYHHYEKKDEHDHYYKKDEHDHHYKKDEHDHDYHDDHRGARQEKIGDLKDMLTEKIIPEVIKTLPKQPLSITFNGLDVNFGNELTPTQVKDQPKVTWQAEKDCLYTLAMVDPDAPSRKDPKFREVNHWLVANIHGSDLSSGETIAAFISSAPPKDTDLHRYVFLLFEQQKRIEVDEKRSPEWSLENRLNFSIAKFAEKYNLGDPLAGNFYKAQWDEYVEEWNKKIKK